MAKTKRQLDNELKMTKHKIVKAEKVITILKEKGVNCLKKEKMLLYRKTKLVDTLNDRIVEIGIEIESLTV